MKNPVPIFTGHVDDNGRLGLNEAERGQRQAHLRSLAGKDVEVVIRRKRSKRSVDQNAYWHAVPFPILAEALGYELIEELKYDLMGACWGWTRSKAGHEIPVKIHTSELDTADGAHFTDWLVQFGAMLPGGGVIIPLPRESEAG